MKHFYKIIVLFFFVNSVRCLNKLKDCECEILPKPRIIGGKPAHHLAYPWMVSISNKPDNTPEHMKLLVNDEAKSKHHSCGGAIINEKWILTAHHCLPKNSTQSIYVGYGNDNDLTKIFDFGRIKSTRTIKNPEYKEYLSHAYNDIGLIELEKPIHFTDSVKPACFSREKLQKYPGLLKHVGWGKTEVIKIDPKTKDYPKLTTPKNLQEISLVDESDTYENCKHDGKVICAKGSEKNQSSCKGDSGGPVHYTKNGRSYVIGLTSFSNDRIFENGIEHICVGTTVYTRVSSFIDWIKHYVNEDICDF